MKEVKVAELLYTTSLVVLVAGVDKKELSRLTIFNTVKSEVLSEEEMSSAITLLKPYKNGYSHYKHCFAISNQ